MRLGGGGPPCGASSVTPGAIDDASVLRRRHAPVPMAMDVAQANELLPKPRQPTPSSHSVRQVVRKRRTE